MRQLHKNYQNAQSNEPSAEIIVVYQKEPHAGQLAFKDVEQPETIEQRIALARRMKDEYELPMTVLVDSMQDQSRALFSDLPSPAFVIDKEGVIRSKFPWADAETIQPAVAKLPEVKAKKSGVSPAIWILLLFVIFLPMLMRLLQTNAKKSGPAEALT